MDIDDKLKYLVPRIIRHKCVTVVGSEAILKPNKDNNDTGDSMVRLLKRAAIDMEINPEVVNKCKSETDFWQIKNFKPLGGDLDKMWTKDPYSREKTVPDDIFADGLLPLLSWNRIVFTTATDPMIEYAMRKAHAKSKKELKVINLRRHEDQSELASYLENYLQNPYETPPILVFLLGRVVGGNAPYNENSYVHAITDMSLAIHHGQNGRIRDHIMQQSSLLMVGTLMDDWRFRFIWHTLTRVDKNDLVLHEKKDNLDKDCTVVFTQMSERLQDEDFSNFYNNTSEFMHSLKEKLCSKEINDLALKDYNGQQTVFISYKHSNYSEANSLCEMLIKKGYNVWFDESSLLPGDRYLEVIHKALDKTKNIVLLLTKDVGEDLDALSRNKKFKMNGNIDVQLANLYKNNETCFYILHEWRYAVKKKKDVKIIPVNTNGYYTNEDYHRVFNLLMDCRSEQDMISVKEIDLNLNDAQFVDKICDKINKKEP